MSYEIKKRSDKPRIFYLDRTWFVKYKMHVGTAHTVSQAYHKALQMIRTYKNDPTA